MYSPFLRPPKLNFPSRIIVNIVHSREPSLLAGNIGWIPSVVRFKSSSVSPSIIPETENTSASPFISSRTSCGPSPPVTSISRSSNGSGGPHIGGLFATSL